MDGLTPRATKRTAQVVEVVEFKDPMARAGKRARPASMPPASEVKSAGSVARAGSAAGSAAGTAKPEPGAFQDIWREVHDLGASQFTGKDRKVWEAKQIEALGGRVNHTIKMPYKMFKGVQAARARRATKQAEMDRASGVVKANSSVKPNKAGNRRKGRPDTLGSGGVGRFKDGVLHVNHKKLSRNEE